METLNNELVTWLQQFGLAEGGVQFVQRLVVIGAVLLIAYVLDMICRKGIVPMVKKVTAKTQVTWDDYLLNDKLLNNLCHLISPIVIYALIPLAFSVTTPLLAHRLLPCRYEGRLALERIFGRIMRHPIHLECRIFIIYE